jgi:hypothetical protein
MHFYLDGDEAAGTLSKWLAIASSVVRTATFCEYHTIGSEHAAVTMSVAQIDAETYCT